MSENNAKLSAPVRAEAAKTITPHTVNPLNGFTAADRPASPVREAEPSVAGPMTRSLAAFERACLVHLGDEQRRANPDNALIAVLCDAVRLARESSNPAGLREAEPLKALVDKMRRDYCEVCKARCAHVDGWNQAVDAFLAALEGAATKGQD